MAAVATLAQANVRDQLVVAAGGALDGSPTGNGWRSAHLIDSQSLGCKASVRNLTGKILKRGPLAAPSTYGRKAVPKDFPGGSST
jgi:hypothetical protein